MTRFLTCVALFTGVVTGLAAGRDQPPTFRGGSDVVRVFVTVTDRDGRLVTSLVQGDFEVRDDGKAQPITVFDNSPQPIRLIVMLDVSGSMYGNLPLLREATGQLLTRLRPDDAVRLGSFGHEVVLSEEFTRDPKALREALPDDIAQDAPTPLWRAVDQAIGAFEKAPDARSVVLVLSDGKDSGPTDFRKRYVSQGEVIDRARAEDVMIYGIGMRSRGARQMQPGIGSQGLRAMLEADLPDSGLARAAQETGGGYTEIRFGQDLGAAFAQVADELHSQYLLGYAPPRRDGKVHDIEVKLAKRGLEPRARKSYVASKSQASDPQ